MNYKNLREFDLSTITKDSKITIIKQSDFGFPLSINLKVNSVEFKNYAQYKDCIYVTGVLKGKRKLRGYLLRPNEEFSIFEGFVDAKDSSRIVSSDNKVTVRSLGRCFDSSSLKVAADIDANLIFSTL